MAKKKAIMRKVLSCLVIIAILMSVMPVSVTSVKASNSCFTQEWYQISSNGQIYTINVVTTIPTTDMDQKPLIQSDPIIGIYLVDSNGNFLTDEALAKNLVIDAQSSARFINDMDLWSFTRSISLSDLYSEIRTDYSRNNYLVIGPAYTADWWRDMFLYTDTILPPPLPSLKGLDNYDHRVEIWEGVILDAALQPELYDNLEDNPQLQQDLSDLHDALVFAGHDYTISNIILQGEGTFRLRPKEIQTTLNNWGKVSAHAKMMKHLDKLGQAFAVAGVGVQILEITGDANRMFVLHTLANARAEERLDALGEYIKANKDELDPAIVKAYDNARHKFDDIYKKYYDEVGNLIRSAIQSDSLINLGFATTSLYAAFKSTALGKVLLPYYLSWEVYKGLRDKNEKVQRLTMAATLQRHLADQTAAEGLETLQRDLASSDLKNKNSIETALVLYNINQYFGWYFYHNYYEVLDDPVFGPIQDFFTGGRLSDYLDHLDSQASLDKANCIQTQKPYLLTEFNLYGWHDYSWLVNKLVYSHFNILVSPEKDWYVPGETAKVTIDIMNIGDKKSLWLGVSFKDPTGVSTKYDPQIIITPQSASIDPCKTKTFTVEWAIPDDALQGQYEIAVNCWKDATFTEKYTDNLEWEPIFSILPFSEFTPLDLCMVLDRSGSMRESMGAKTKMEGVKEAATGVVNVLFPQDRVSIVSFSDTATTNMDLTSNFNAVKTKINQITAGGSTSFGAGLETALVQFNAHGNPDHNPAILFMSDGKHNKAPDPEAYVTQCNNKGIPIFTVGFASSESQVDVIKLKKMAEETGGEYLFVSEIFDLQNIFLKLQHKASGWESIATYIGRVNQGETITAGTFYVDPAIDDLRVTLNWPGSNLDLKLFDPSSRQIDFGASNVIYSGDTKPEYVIIKDPQSGTWTAKVYGKSIGSSEKYYVLVTKYEPPTPPPPPICKVQITSNLSLQDRPSIVYANGNYYVAYQSHEKGYGIYIKQFDSQWNFKKKVEVVSGSAYYDSPSLVYANNKLYVAYISNAKGASANDYDIIVKEYNPNSLSCTKGAKYLTSLQSCQDLPALLYKDGYFYLAYQSWETGNGDIYIKKFDSSWNQLKKVRVTTKSSLQDRPSLIYANGYFYVAYFSGETGYYDIFVKRLDSNLNLESWKKQITSKSSYQSYPFITFVNNQFAIVYASTETGTLGIYLKTYDSNWNFNEKTKVVDDNSAYERRPSMTYAQNNYWVAYVHNYGDSKDWNIFAIIPGCTDGVSPTPTPSPTPSSSCCPTIGVTADKSEYSPGDTVYASISLTGGSCCFQLRAPSPVSLIAPTGETIAQKDFASLFSGSICPGTRSTFGMTLKLPGDAPSGYYDVKVRLSDGEFTKTVNDLFILAGGHPNQPPVNPTLTPNKPEPQTAGTSITWTASATDPDGDAL